MPASVADDLTAVRKAPFKVSFEVNGKYLKGKKGIYLKYYNFISILAMLFYYIMYFLNEGTSQINNLIIILYK